MSRLNRTICDGLDVDWSGSEMDFERHVDDKIPRVDTPWGPLREVIMGRAEGATIPYLEPSIVATTPRLGLELMREKAGDPFPPTLIEGACAELAAFEKALVSAGVVVRRPEVTDFATPIRGGSFSVPCGLYNAMPRDNLLPVGNKVIVAPMAWRCRYNETDSYEEILSAQTEKGVEIVRAPRPKLSDSLYDLDQLDVKDVARYLNAAGGASELSDDFHPILREEEPTFDAADFIPIGFDLFGQLSHVTNWTGIRWLSRALGSQYRIHVLSPTDSSPMHIDATLVPLKPGLLLLNEKRLPRERLPNYFDDWQILAAPPPQAPDGLPLYFSSRWLSMNLLVVDPNTVVVSPHEEILASMLQAEGFTILTACLDNFNALGGGSHCATVELSRDRTSLACG